MRDDVFALVKRYVNSRSEAIHDKGNVPFLEDPVFQLRISVLHLMVLGADPVLSQIVSTYEIWSQSAYYVNDSLLYSFLRTGRPEIPGFLLAVARAPIQCSILLT